MATTAGTAETATSTSTTGTEGTETGQQGQQVQQQAATPETGGQVQQQASTPEKPVELPDDHPLVKTLATQKAAIASQKSEIAELRATSAKVTQLEDDIKTRPSKEAVETLQKRSDRLESFLQAVGGPLGKALDSKTFTKELFESDKDIAEIVKEWNRNNPSATSEALGSAAAAPASKAPDMNVLLRSALKQ